MTNKKLALAKEIEVDVENIEVELYNDSIFIVGDKEYKVLTEEEREEAVTDYISESLWAFNPSFSSNMTGIDESAFQALSELYESGNEGVKSIIEATCGLEKFVDEAVSIDGYGHFLSGYDGIELELDDNLYAYRTN